MGRRPRPLARLRHDAKRVTGPGWQGGGGARSGATCDPGVPGENAAAFSLGWGVDNAARRDAGTREPGSPVAGAFGAGEPARPSLGSYRGVWGLAVAGVGAGGGQERLVVLLVADRDPGALTGERPDSDPVKGTAGGEVLGVLVQPQPDEVGLGGRHRP